MVTERHKVFLSFHHRLDEDYKDTFCKLLGTGIVDKSVEDGDIDPGLKVDTVRSRIRDDFIADATVTVVLVGRCTWQRKHVDWEIGSSLRDTKKNSRCGLLGILLPSHPDHGRPEYRSRLIPPRLADNAGRKVRSRRSTIGPCRGMDGNCGDGSTRRSSGGGRRTRITRGRSSHGTGPAGARTDGRIDRCGNRRSALAAIAGGELVCQKSGKGDVSRMKVVKTRTPVQIVVARDRTDRRTDAYVDTLRIAFEGSADSAGSPSAYLAEAVDLGIRVLEPGAGLETIEARRLVEGARDTVFVVIGDWPEGSDELHGRSRGREVVKVPSPPERGDGETQGARPEDGVELRLRRW